MAVMFVYIKIVCDMMHGTAFASDNEDGVPL